MFFVLLYCICFFTCFARADTIINHTCCCCIPYSSVYCASVSLFVVFRLIVALTIASFFFVRSTKQTNDQQTTRHPKRSRVFGQSAGRSGRCRCYRCVFVLLLFVSFVVLFVLLLDWCLCSIMLLSFGFHGCGSFCFCCRVGSPSFFVVFRSMRFCCFLFASSYL